MEEGAEQLPGVSSKKTIEREITTFYLLYHIYGKQWGLNHNL